MKAGFGMGKWAYVANTFQTTEKGGLNPIQVSGFVFAESDEDAVQKLKDDGIIYPTGYEFLELKLV